MPHRPVSFYKKLGEDDYVIKETRTTTGFQEIKSEISDEMIILPGKPFNLELEDQQNIINLLKTNL